METGPAEILLLRPPASGRKRAHASPRARATPRSEGRPGGAARLPGPQAAHERASSGQGIDYVIRIVNWVKCPSMYPDKK